MNLTKGKREMNQAALDNWKKLAEKMNKFSKRSYFLHFQDILNKLNSCNKTKKIVARIDTIKAIMKLLNNIKKENKMKKVIVNTVIYNSQVTYVGWVQIHDSSTGRYLHSHSTGIHRFTKTEARQDAKKLAPEVS
jgi:glutaredoxin 2